jgi:two-component system, sensor histidine kinase and response regulator
MASVEGAELATSIPRRILVVDDDLVNQKVATAMLARLGYNADVVNNGADAVRCILEGTYDLVLMDLNMPVLDGIEATRAVRAATTDGPFIVATTTRVEATTQCYEAGMDDFLAKPLTLEALEGTVRRSAVS